MEMLDELGELVSGRDSSRVGGGGLALDVLELDELLLELELLLLFVAEPEEHAALPDERGVELAERFAEQVLAERAAPLTGSERAHLVVADLAQRDEKVDDRVHRRDGVEQGRLRGYVARLERVVGLCELADQHRAVDVLAVGTRLQVRVEELLALDERVGQRAERLVDDLGLARQVQDGLADLGDRLAGGRGSEVDGQVGQAEYLHEGHEAALLDELLAVVVRGVVAQNGLDELHDVRDVVEQRDALGLFVVVGYKCEMKLEMRQTLSVTLI